MSLLRSGCGLSPEPKRAYLAQSRVLVIAVAATLAGCAQQTTQTAAYDPRVAAPPSHVSADTGRKPDLEDDGREAQLPPMKKAQPEPDDPREPWSRNYGKAAPVQRADVATSPDVAGLGAGRGAGHGTGLGPVVRGSVPADLPPDFRRRLASAFDE